MDKWELIQFNSTRQFTTSKRKPEFEVSNAWKHANNLNKKETLSAMIF